MTLNRLRHQRAYLAGPMDRCPDNGQTWRNTLTPILEEMGISVMNPIMKPINIGKEDINAQKYKQEVKADENYNLLSQLMKEIRNVDLRMVDISDFLIVNLDMDIFPCGTMEELFLANRQKKPIILRIKQGKENTPDWLFGTIPHQMIFSEWSQVVQYLKYVNDCPNIEYYNRWYFFNIKE